MKKFFKSKKENSENLNSPETQEVKIKNTAKWKRGGYSAIIIAAALAALIAINTLLGVLSNKGVKLSFDLSLAKENSISEENIEFIKSIQSPVTITVCSTKDNYSSALSYYAQYYMNVTDESGGYYEQTLNLVELYHDYNPKITVEYLDLTSTAGNAVANEYPNMFYGDLIVRYTDDLGNSRSRLVTFDDIYSYSDSTGYAAYGYASYTIDENNIETALSSAINTVISGETKNAALLKNHSDSTVFESRYKFLLSLNGFNVTEITDNIISSVSQDIDTLLIVSPVSDFLPEELTAINEWLDNGGKKGRSLIFFPSTSVAATPNLNEFLDEWGIKYTDGILYETDDGNHVQGDATTMAVFDCDTDMSKDITVANGAGSIVGHNIPMTQSFDNYSSRTAYTVVSTKDTVVAAPAGMSDDWQPSDNDEKKSYANLIVTKDEGIIDNKTCTSYVCAFSSSDFINSQWSDYSQLENTDLAVNTAVKTAGFVNDTKITFIPKTVTTESFADKVTSSKTMTILVIFAIIIPIAFIVSGIVVYFKRKNR